MQGLKVFIKVFFSYLIIAFQFSSSLYAQDPEQSVINVGKITSWVDNKGFHDWIISNEFNGSYPKGLPIGVVFSEGIVWGGLVYDGLDQKVRVNGNTYQSGCAPNTRLFRVRSDYYDVNLKDDAASYFNKEKNEVTDGDIEIVRSQYEKDWNEWPADKGAPYFDIDYDGKYNPDIDVPGVPGALQTLWINYNDDSSASNYGSIPIGLEIQETYWAYTSLNPLGNVIYRKIDLIYKGTSNSSPNSRIDSMYVHEWADLEVGYCCDNFVGCDTSLNLGFAYNSKDLDSYYEEYGLTPPAVGYSILQGVSHYNGNNSDSAIFNFKWRKGFNYFRSKPFNGFIYQAPGGSWIDPNYDYEGSLMYYNIMRGYLPLPAYPRGILYPSIVADYTSSGFYLLDGDPVAGTGKIDGYVEGPGSRRFYVISGPFNMNLGDTAEVVIALIGGMGDDHLSSVTELRKNTRAATNFFNYFVEEMTAGTMEVEPPTRPSSNQAPSNYILFQNYPNPFNSYTTIRYELPEAAFVTLVIYDVLGREVKRLVSEEKEAGKYSVQFDANKLSSGVYFYKISFDNQSNKMVFDGLNKTMKLILVK